MKSEGVLYTGVPSYEELSSCPGVPGEEVMRMKKIPRIECVQAIPCNPCEGICPTHAIIIGDNITDLPIIDPDKCIGCGLCVANCPGLAITMIDKCSSDTHATIDFPFEYVPLPNVGDEMIAVGRDGQPVCPGEIMSVKKIKSYNGTTVVSIKVPMEFADDVVSMKRLGIE